MKRFFMCALLLMLVGISYAQAQTKISGRVTDSKTGEPIPFASIMVKGTTIGVSANEDGAYSITIPSSDEQASLLFSFVGFTNKEEVVGTRTTIDVSLESAVNQLDEAVVVGYGTQKKSSITGSISTIKMDKLDSRPVTSVSAALAGQIAGVTAIQNSGAPGSQTASLTIRGKNSINATSPLVIVDGVPGSMNNINPSDIESMTVLKDASSSAIYGVQAANGVILITTKAGKKGAPARVNYSADMAFVRPVTRLKFLESGDYAMLYREAEINEHVDERALRYSLEDIENFRRGAEGFFNTDWYNETFKPWAFEHRHHLSLNGGSDKTNYNAAVGYDNQGWIDEKTNYERFTGRTNLTSRINNWFTVGLNASGDRGIKNEGWTGTDGLTQYSNRLNPTLPVFVNDDPAKGFAFDGYENPVALNGTDGFRRTTTQNLFVILHGTINFMPNLSLKGLYSVNNSQTFQEGFKKRLVYGDLTSTNPNNIEDTGDREAYNNNTHSNKYLTQLLLNYNTTFAKDHSIAALAGFEQSLYTYKWTNASRKGGGTNELSALNTLSEDGQKNEGSGREVARRSYFGRVQYDYLNRYFLEANIRLDASSIFPKDTRWGTFPAFSGAWIISREEFMSDAKWLSHLKLRAGWGQTGNEEIKADQVYPSANTYAFDEKVILGNGVYNTAREARYANQELKWATVTNYELGLEANFLENKIGFDLSLYKKNTNDMLLQLAVPSILGMDPPLQNAGSVQNTGFDFSMFHNLVVNNDFRYSLRFNLAYVRNEITDLKDANNTIDPDDGKFIRSQGYAIGSFYGYNALGFFNTPEELASLPKRTGKEELGDIRYEDMPDEHGNKNGKIEAADRQVIGKNFPSWTLGFGSDFYYKDFELSLFFQGAFNVDAYYESEAAFAFFNGGKVLERHLDRWTPTNHNATYPRMTRNSQINFERTSSFWLEDVSYVRLKNVTFAYNLPASITSKLSIENARVFFSGENMLTFGGVQGLDPESPSTTRGAFSPNVKKLSVGLNITF